MSEDYRVIALEAARAYAHDTADLIARAIEIEHYLRFGSQATAKATTNPPAPVEETPEEKKKRIAEEEKAERQKKWDGVEPQLADTIVELSTRLIAESESEIARGEEFERAELALQEKHKMAELIEAVDKTDISAGSPIVPAQSLDDDFKMRINKDITDLHLNVAADMHYTKCDVAINISQSFDGEALVAAYARQESARRKKILVLAGSHSEQLRIIQMIDNLSVNVSSFANIAALDWSGECYDLILISNASSMPYSYEEAIKTYLKKCNCTNSVARDKRTKVIAVSVPGQAQGFFHDMFCVREDVRKITVNYTKLNTDWNWEKIKAKLGDKRFANLHDNQFRPVE